MDNIQAVILCGGEGTRLREYTEEIPKPMVEIGGIPILWHIMRIYSHFGFNDFVLCLGYKGEKIKEYFVKTEDWRKSDFTLQWGANRRRIQYHNNNKVKWNIVFAETGPKTNTGGRIKRIEKYITSSPFFVTYGDGLADIDLHDLLEYHKHKGKIATITCVKPVSQFGIVEIDSAGVITRYREKPPMREWVSGGFFVFNKEIFSYLGDNDILEREPFERLAKEGNLCAYKFEGFWKCMDTYKDTQLLNELWYSGNAPWKLWKD